MYHLHDWMPIDLPLPADGQVITTQFKADINTTYDVQVELQKKSPFHELEAIKAPIIDIKVTCNNQEVQNTLCRPECYSFWGNAVFGFDLAEFKGEVGKTYLISAKFQKAESKLVQLNPRLQIEVANSDRKSYGLVARSLVTVPIVLYIAAIIKGIKRQVNKHIHRPLSNRINK